MDDSDLIDAANTLSRSARGREAMRVLLAWLDDTGLGLDSQNQEAVLILLQGAFAFPGTARDVMRDVAAQETA